MEGREGVEAEAGLDDLLDAEQGVGLGLFFGGGDVPQVDDFVGTGLRTAAAISRAYLRLRASIWRRRELIVSIFSFLLPYPVISGHCWGLGFFYMDGQDGQDLRGCCMGIIVHKFYMFGKGWESLH